VLFALADEAFASVFSSADVLDLIPSEDLRLLIFEAKEETIIRWIPS
jgi:hypothetical protein